MNKLQSYIINLLPPYHQRKNGWYYFNGVCCESIGQEMADTKHRGNLILTETGFIYNCFNCRFKCGWSVGSHMTSNFKKFLYCLGCDSKKITEVYQIIDELNGIGVSDVKVEAPKPRIIRDIPNGYKSIKESIYNNEQSATLTKIMGYLGMRNSRLLSWSDLMWKEGDDAFLIPCYEFNKIVGYSLRRIDDKTPKYIHYVPSGYLFNFDKLLTDRKKVVIVEGQTDALAIDGISLLSNVFTEDKLKRLQIYGKDKEIILLPDRDKPGMKMVQQMLDLNLPFGVSFPNWEKGIKDAEDAVKKYGRLYTIYTILNSVETDRDKIRIKMKLWSKE